MPPIHARKNQYHGVNAHLHSYLQQPGQWKGFHTVHIASLAVALKAQLIPLGYTANIETSLQIRVYEEGLRQPRSDVSIYDRLPARREQPQEIYRPGEGMLVVPLRDVIEVEDEDEENYGAISIRRFGYDRGSPPPPIAWIEFLSPSNKPGGGSTAVQYADKRRNLLRLGVVFLEIDYLHETFATIHSIPQYPDQMPGSHPYRLILFVPRPDFYDGITSVSEFNVDEPIPALEIPLSAGDTFMFDFDAVYQKLFEDMLYGLDEVDYSGLPANFDRYSPADQSRIAARMLAIHAAVERGDDLETSAPLPVEPVELETALAEIESWGK